MIDYIRNVNVNNYNLVIVLVTGGAGFIGFHTASKLVDERNADVTVLDNFNNYYDVNLKKARADVLKKKGIVHIRSLHSEIDVMSMEIQAQNVHVCFWIVYL